MHSVLHPLSNRFSLTLTILSALLCGFGLAQDGTLLWQFPVGGSMSKCPAIDEEGVVYISAPDQNVHALNGETGEVRWSYPTGADPSSAPVLGEDGTVFVGLADQNIVALNGQTGELLWKTPSGGVVTVLGLSDKGLLCGHGNGGLALALTASTGVMLWESVLPIRRSSSGVAVTPEGDFLVAASGLPPGGGRLVKVDAADGTLLLNYSTHNSRNDSSHPALGADGTAYTGYNSDFLYAVDTVSGSLQWKALIPGGTTSTKCPLVIGPDGMVYVITDRLYGMNPATGRIQWVFGPDGVLQDSSPALAADGTIYVGTWLAPLEGILHAIDTETGQEKWRFSRPTPMSSPPAIGPGGVVYVACGDGNLYAVRGSAPLANSPWPKWQQNPANSGQSHWARGTAAVLGQSGDQLAAAGSTLRFWVNARGTPPFEYQWYRNGEPIPDVTSNCLVLPEVGSADEATYHAVISNSLGEATSAPMQLTMGYSLAVDWYPVLGTVTGVPEDAVLLSGLEVTLAAHQAEGREFLGWEGDIKSTENPLTFRVESNLHIRARFAVDPGTVLWAYDTGERVRGSAAIGSDGTVYFGADYRLLAVKGDSGALKWCTGRVWGQQTPTPVVGPAGLVYGGDPNRVLAFEAATGQFVWELPGCSGMQTVPTPVSLGSDGTVYHSDDYRKLRALNGLTGDILWEIQTADNASPPAVGVDGRLYVSTYGGRIQSFDPGNGSELWNVESGANAYHTPALDGFGNLFAAAGLGGPIEVTRVVATTGERLWTTRLSTYFSSPTLGLNETVLVQTASGAFCLSQADGQILWSIPEARTSDCSPATASDGTVYLGSNDGLFRAVNGQTGEVIWTFQAKDGIYCSPNIGADGTVYIGSYDGRLYAIAGSASLADTPWPKYQADIRNTGRVNAPPVGPLKVQLLGARLREDGTFVLEVQGPSAAEGVLEQSENLRDWTDAGGVVLDETGHATVADESGLAGTGRFYRVRLGP